MIKTLLLDRILWRNFLATTAIYWLITLRLALSGELAGRALQDCLAVDTLVTLLFLGMYLFTKARYGRSQKPRHKEL